LETIKLAKSFGLMGCTAIRGSLCQSSQLLMSFWLALLWPWDLKKKVLQRLA